MILPRGVKMSCTSVRHTAKHLIHRSKCSIVRGESSLAEHLWSDVLAVLRACVCIAAPAKWDSACPVRVLRGYRALEGD